MAFMDNVKRVAADTAQKAVKKSGELVETAKIKYAIFDLKNEIKRVYEDIGSDMYKNYSENIDVTDSVRQKCARVDDLKQDIKELCYKLDDLKDSVHCRSCGKSCKLDMEYCPYCGSRMDTDNIVEAEIKE